LLPSNEIPFGEPAVAKFQALSSWRKKENPCRCTSTTAKMLIM
jgi:hypothetical protein